MICDLDNFSNEFSSNPFRLRQNTRLEINACRAPSTRPKSEVFFFFISTTCRTGRGEGGGEGGREIRDSEESKEGARGRGGARRGTYTHVQELNKILKINQKNKIYYFLRVCLVANDGHLSLVQLDNFQRFLQTGYERLVAEG
jgi:hypothetical protein